MKKSAELFSGRHSFLTAFIICAVFISGILFISPVSALSSLSFNSFSNTQPDTYGNESNVLISDGYILLHKDEISTFEQGYGVSQKGVGSNNSVLVEFQNNLSDLRIVGDVILKEGDDIRCYRVSKSGQNLILTMTLDKVFINSSTVILGFSSVYQYADPDVLNYSTDASWIIDVTNPNSTDPNNPGNPSGNGTDWMNLDLISNPVYVISIICIIFIIAIFISFYFKKRVQEEK